jgi:hypothetical protein
VLARRKGGFKAIVNEALRHGLRQLDALPERRTAYRTPSVDTGRCLLPNVDDIAEVLAMTEGAGQK